jgi:hypothetical protein
VTGLQSAGLIFAGAVSVLAAGALVLLWRQRERSAHVARLRRPPVVQAQPVQQLR